ncbi:hypothetical protein ACFV3N_28600 [Streptomyces bauhiniae]|uniref:hypothetical protein n=1 Tax=Streptomyces bauhiniae TaxID=2340725 RepID=UPI0036623BA2
MKSSSSRRGVPVPTAVTDALNAHVQAFPATPQTMADTTDGNRRERKVRLVFTTAAGEPLQRSPWARTWRKMVTGANKILADRGKE